MEQEKGWAESAVAALDAARARAESEGNAKVTLRRDEAAAIVKEIDRLRAEEGLSVAVICDKLDVLPDMYYRWKRSLAGDTGRPKPPRAKVELRQFLVPNEKQEERPTPIQSGDGKFVLILGDRNTLPSAVEFARTFFSEAR